MRVIVEEHEKLSPNLIFEIIRHDGEMELERPAWPLICRRWRQVDDFVFRFISALSSMSMSARLPGRGRLRASAIRRGS